MATHFLPLSKNVSCTSTPQGKHLCQISWELVKNWGSSSRRKIFPIFAIICRYHGISDTFYHCPKICLAHLHPKANICAKFHENWWKTEEVVRDARFSPHFCHNMPLPWQRTFYHCQKMCLAHLHPKANICAKFHENWWKTEEVVRDARFFPHFCHNMPVTMATLFLVTVEKCVLHIYTPRQTSLPNSSLELVKNWGSSSYGKIGDRPPDRPTSLATDRPTDDTLIPIYPPYTLRVCGLV